MIENIKHGIWLVGMTFVVLTLPVWLFVFLILWIIPAGIYEIFGDRIKDKEKITS